MPRALAFAPASVLFAFLLGVALATTPSRYGPAELAAVALLYALLALALHSLAAGVARRGLWAAVLGSLPVGLAVLWHLKEQVWLPHSRTSLAAGSLLVAAFYGVAVRMLARWGAGPGPRSSLLAFAAFALLWTGAFHASNSLRWHLLRHNKILGTPAYYAFGTPVAELVGSLWAAHSSEAAATPVDTTPAAARGPRPNLVFVMLDTLRADVLAAYGGNPDLMPNVNALAARSLVLGDVLANAGWTRPSVASMFTGLPQERHGAVDRMDRLPEGHTTLAERFRARGYRTAAFVTNFGAVGREAGFAQGFDAFEELHGRGAAYQRAAEVTFRVRRWLREERRAGRREPLFLYVHYLDPHRPYLSGGRNSALDEVAMDAYRAELRYLDDYLGELLRSVESDLAGRTLVLIASDHGEEFGEHAERGHGHSLYREVLHVPVLLHGVGISGRADQRLEGRDLYDLLLTLTAGEAEDTDPRDWLARRDRDRRHASLFLTTAFPLERPYLSDVAMRALERGPLYLIWSGYGSTFELYDEREDPDQLRNLAGAEPGLVDEMARELEEVVPRWTQRERIGHSDRILEQLRALGYIH